MRLIAYKNKPLRLEIHVPPDVLGAGEKVYADIYKPDGTLVTSTPVELQQIPGTNVWYAETTAPSEPGKYDIEFWRGTYDATTGTRNKTETLKYVGLEVKNVDPDDLATKVDEIEAKINTIIKNLSIYVT